MVLQTLTLSVTLTLPTHTQDGGEYFSTSEDAANENLRFLLSLSLDVNVRDNKDMTPLHLAVCEGHASTVHILLEHGADSNARQQQGRTPLDLAIIFRRIAIRDTLTKAGGVSGAIDAAGAMDDAAPAAGGQGPTAQARAGALPGAQ